MIKYIVHKLIIASPKTTLFCTWSKRLYAHPMQLFFWSSPVQIESNISQRHNATWFIFAKPAIIPWRLASVVLPYADIYRSHLEVTLTKVKHFPDSDHYDQ